MRHLPWRTPSRQASWHRTSRRRQRRPQPIPIKAPSMAAAAKRKPERDETALASRGLDGLNLFVANIQTGFGPFIAVYLTTQGWTQTSIGTALSLGTVAAMASQL